MEAAIDPETSVLVAQVRRAEASHKMDVSNQLLRGRHFQGPSSVVYLGEVAQALLAHLAHPETPSFLQPPGYNEQRWILETQSSELHVMIESRPYWGFGLLNSGYLNVLRLTGPLHVRARLILDVHSSIGQPPWEMAHPSSAERYLRRHHPGLTLKENERAWKALRDVARSSLGEAIESFIHRGKDILSSIEENEDTIAWITAFEEDTHMAKQAHAEDNAPGVERALARMEATMIHLDPTTERAFVHAPEERFATDGDLMSWPQGPIGMANQETAALLEDDDIPFVDLASTSTEQE